MAPVTGAMVPFDIGVLDPVQRIQKFIDAYRNNSNYKGFEAVLMRNIRIVSAEPAPSGASRESWLARAVFELEIVPELCNPMDNMHGGAVALTADMATTMAAAPASSKGFWEFGGVSRNLSVTYIAPMPLGTTVEVDCELISAGSRHSLLQCKFRDRTSRILLAVAEHGKVAVGVQLKEVNEKETVKL